MKSLSVFLILWTLQFCHSQTPVPARPKGYLLTPWPAEPPMIVVEAFYDHLCPDSKANWPILQAVAKEVESKGVTMILHIFPLPYHHNAYFTQLAGVVVQNEKTDKFADYVQLMFDHQDDFLMGAVNMSEPEVQSSMAKLVSSTFGIDLDTILSGFSDGVIVENARYAWKYAASRGISGTPSFLVNGVHAEVNNTVTAWTTYIQKLLNSPY